MNTRGEVVTLVLVLCGALGATQLVPNWRPSHWFQKKPPVQQVVDGQKELEALRRQLAQAKATAAAAQEKAEADKAEQLRYAQQNAAGTDSALSRVPSEHRVPEVILAQSLNNRALAGLGAAIGGLPVEQQKAIEQIVTGALSKVQAERDEALAKLAARDEQLRVATADRQKIEAQIPVLTTKVNDLQGKVVDKEQIVAEKTAEVTKWASEKVASDERAGSLAALWARVQFWIVAAVILYVLFHYALPSLAVEFPQFSLLQRAYRAVTSIISSHPLSIK